MTAFGAAPTSRQPPTPLPFRLLASSPPNPAPSFGVDSLGIILRTLAALIARRFLNHPLHATLTIPLWQHLTRAASRLDRLRAQLE